MGRGGARAVALAYPAVAGCRGRVVETPLTTPDILPTLLGLAGVAIPSTIEGEDLSPLLRDRREQLSLRRPVHGRGAVCRQRVQ